MKFLRNYLKARTEKKKRIEEATKQVISNYNNLIKEYNLIIEKKSTLSKKERDNVMLTIAYLIEKKHLVFNK